MDAALPRYQASIGAASLIVGPALMSVGDLFHPHETWDVAAQVAMVAEAPTRWYAAHLLLFIGMLLFVPGIFVLSSLAVERRPVRGYAARVLLLLSVGALSAVFVSEMLLGRFAITGPGEAATVALFQTFQSASILGALMPGLLAFFIGVGLFVATVASQPGPLRAPAFFLALGAALILGEIILAQVLLSQIGNIMILVSGILFARLVLRRPGVAPA